MIKTIIIILLALPLLSGAPKRAPVYTVRLFVQTSAPAAKQCDAATARAGGSYLRQIVYDPTGAPFGEVAAWTCGDAEAAIAELRERQQVMQGEANAYRAAHPIGGKP